MNGDPNVKIWDTMSGKEALTFAKHKGLVNSLMTSPNGKWVASGGEDGTVRVWDAKTGAEVMDPYPHIGFVWGVAFSPDGKRLASASGYSGKGQVRIWQVLLPDQKVPKNR